ncbi:hypothetical protein OGCDGJMD_02051 [Cyanobium usitatum str. Tous]|jgi:hypothetical protein|nr:hypothetical protein OGCDGJMD_02051 [Cyanobium usitatum str. Tous]
MKKAAVATTTAKGAAVNSSKITAVQSVYIAQRPNRSHHPSKPFWLPIPMARIFPMAPIFRSALAVGAISTALLVGQPGRAGVEFDNCQPAADGGISCDTRPTGNTQMDDEAARYGLVNDASPGWSEFDPDQGFEDDLGGNDT